MDADGAICQIHGVEQEFNIFGSSSLDQLENVHSILQQSSPSFHILIVNDVAMLLIVVLVDSHVHGSINGYLSSIPGHSSPMVFSLF